MFPTVAIGNPAVRVVDEFCMTRSDEGSGKSGKENE